MGSVGLVVTYKGNQASSTDSEMRAYMQPKLAKDVVNEVVELDEEECNTRS